MTKPKIFEDIGEVENLTTTAKTVVGGINELDNELTVLTTNKADKSYVDQQDSALSNEINNCLTELETVKQSVSSGKSKVATAITGKGVPTVATATFQQMATNIDSIKLGSGNATADKVLTPFTFTNNTGVEQAGTMPNNGDVASAIVNAVLKAGYTTGGTIANAVSGNIKKGINIAGIIGNYEQLKSARGTVTSKVEPVKKALYFQATTSSSQIYIEVTGLAFEPLVVVSKNPATTTIMSYAINKRLLTSLGLEKAHDMMSYQKIQGSASYATLFGGMSGYHGITSNGFVIPVGASDLQVNWEAWGI